MFIVEEFITDGKSEIRTNIIVIDAATFRVAVERFKKKYGTRITHARMEKNGTPVYSRFSYEIIQPDGAYFVAYGFMENVKVKDI